MGYGTNPEGRFRLKYGVPDLNTEVGRAEYKTRANAVLENFFGPGTEITQGAGEITENIAAAVVNGSLLVFGLGAGAESGFALVRGLTYTAEAGLSCYAIYDGSIRTYEGIEEGDEVKATLGAGETALGIFGLYGSSRALYGELLPFGSTSTKIPGQFIGDIKVEARALMSQGMTREEAFAQIRSFRAGNADDFLFHFTNRAGGTGIVNSQSLRPTINGLGGPGVYTGTVPNPNFFQRFFSPIGWGVNPGSSVRIPIRITQELQPKIRTPLLPRWTRIIGEGEVIPLKPPLSP
jgi:hypothetical protein